MKQLLVLKETTDNIKKASDIFKSIKKINIDYSQENLILFCLNTKNEIIHSEVAFKGGLNSFEIDPKTLFRKALINNSKSIIIAHNHPSGNLSPSNEDIDSFRSIREAGDILTLTCLDHIIFNEKEFYSIADAR
jgi:DNA repair protein RadC